MFVENNDIQQLRHAGDDVHWNERPSLQYYFFCKEYPIIILYLLFIHSKKHLYINI